MVKLLKRLFRRYKILPAKYPTTRIYTDTHGNNWYMFDSVQEMPADRMWRAALYTRHADLCLTPERLALLTKTAYAALNTKDIKIADAAVCIQEILLALDHYAEQDTLLDLATVYIIGEDEDLTNFSEAYRQKKKQLWKSDPSAMAFFLSIVWRRTKAFSKHSDINILEYLAEHKATQSEYRKGHPNI